MRKVMVALLAVGFILTASFSAKADTVLFPWVVKDKAISTLISLVNTHDPGSSKIRFHLIYFYKETTKNEQTEACEEVDFCAPTSPNDIVVFDAAGNFNNGVPLFGDTAVKGTKYTSMGVSSLALPVDGPRRAFLMVNNEVYTTQQCGGGFDAEDGTLYGEAMVVDISNGAAWGYTAYNPRGASSWNDFSDNEADPASIPTDQFGEVITDNETAKLVIMPPSVFTTKIFTTPVYSNQWNGSLATSIQLYCDSLSGMFDADENCISFDKIKDVTCTDASTIDHFVSDGAWIIFKNTNAEGWAVLRVFEGTAQAVVGKLEYNIGTTTFDGSSVKGAINNFIWLRAHRD